MSGSVLGFPFFALVLLGNAGGMAHHYAGRYRWAIKIALWVTFGIVFQAFFMVRP